MNLTISSSNPISGMIEKEIPGDKSISHRAALFAALATGTSQINNFQVSGVTRPMLQALTSLGVSWNLAGEHLTVEGKGMGKLKKPTFPIDCANSATTLRLLAGAIAGAGITATLDGTPGLRKRPMGRIVDPLREMGVNVSPSTTGTAPISIVSRQKGTWLKHLQYDLPVASAQVKSCLILAALGAQGKSTLSEPTSSRDHTERMLSSMGVEITCHEESSHNIIELTPPDPLILSPLHLAIPGDPSAAAFLIVAALIVPGSLLEIRNICLNPTRTGLIDALKSMGGNIKIMNQHLDAGEPVGDLLIEHSNLHSIEISGTLVVRMIDEFPILAVAATLAEGSTSVRDASELRFKESDRITALATELRILGISVEEHPDGFKIHGGKLHGGNVDSHGDHRLAMSLAVAGLVADSPITIKNAQCTAESFPGFAETLQKLGGNVQIKEDFHVG